MTGYVYAIGNADIVKIGFSRNPETRLAQIQTDSSIPCQVFGYIEATQFQENELHELISPYRHHREWFKRGSIAVEYFISSLVRRPPPDKPAKVTSLAGRKLATHLQANSISASRFAEGLGVPPSTITRIIKGQRGPGIDLAFRIAQATSGEISVDEFAGSAQ